MAKLYQGHYRDFWGNLSMGRVTFGDYFWGRLGDYGEWANLPGPQEREGGLTVRRGLGLGSRIN